MEWRVDGPRHRLYRPPSACRSLPVQQARFREQGLWGTITMLSLFAGTIMASSEILGAASGSMGSVSSASMEENSMETPSLAVRNNWHGENMQDLSTPELRRAERSPSRSRGAMRGSRRREDASSNRNCRLQTRRIHVRDLGLGYDSDEMIIFKFCSGTCAFARTEYHLAMSNLVQRGYIGVKRENYVSQPCCRPTQLENLSFLDTHSVWQNLPNTTAVECGCLG